MPSDQPEPSLGAETTLLLRQAAGLVPGSGLRERRLAWQSARDSLEQVPAPACVRDLCDLHDSLTCLLFNHVREAGKSTQGSLLLAVGGTGRHEMLPGSDLDLCLVVENDPDAYCEALASDIFTPLWDLGITVGQAVHSIASCCQAAAEDQTRATALLEGRFLAGDQELFSRLRGELMGPWLQSNLRRFTTAKLHETRHRHASHADTPFVNEPDLKAGRGYLRDHQLGRLLSALILTVDGSPGESESSQRLLPTMPDAREHTAGPGDPFVASKLLRIEEARELAAAATLLISARFARHRYSESDPTAPRHRYSERLDLHTQPALAERLGFLGGEGLTASEQMMRHIYRASSLVDRSLALAVTSLASRASGRSHRSRSLRRRAVAPGMVAVDREIFFTSNPGASGLLTVTRPAEGTAIAPSFALEAFLTAQRLGLDLATSALEKIRRGLSGIDDAFRHSPHAAAGFREILSGHVVAPTIRSMHRCGWLGDYLPEFGDIDGLVQSDGYHQFSVDEHSLQGLENLEGPASKLPPTGRKQQEDRLRRELFARVPMRDILRLSLLVHDTGKVGGSVGHVERGVARVGVLARRLHLDLAQEQALRLLVEQHLRLSTLATKRDIDAPETSEELAVACHMSCHHLDRLYLLTCADIRAVGPAAFTRWKDALVTRLYERTRDRILENKALQPPASSEDLVASLHESLPPEISPADLEDHLQKVKRPYLVELEPSEILLHLEILTRLQRARQSNDAVDSQLVTTHELNDGFEHLWVATYDQPALFASLAGVLSGMGMDILGARAFTRTDGLVVDRFAVRAQERDRVHGPELWADLHSKLKAAVVGELDVEQLIASRSRRVAPLSAAEADQNQAPPPTMRPRAEPVRVMVTNKTSPRYTIVEVGAADRPGLLRDLAVALSSLGLDIHSARVATQAHRAEDIFYVTRDGRKLEGRRDMSSLREALTKAVSRRLQES